MIHESYCVGGWYLFNARWHKIEAENEEKSIVFKWGLVDRCIILIVICFSSSPVTFSNSLFICHSFGCPKSCRLLNLMQCLESEKIWDAEFMLLIERRLWHRLWLHSCTCLSLKCMVGFLADCDYHDKSSNRSLWSC